MKKLFKGISIASILALTAVSAASCGNAKADVLDENIDTQLNATSFGNATTANSIDNGNIFHAWDWSMTTIQANLDSIKAAGFTTIQTSPMQPQKDYWAGNTSKEAWWKLYQPLGFSIATKNNALGTKTQLKSMVSAAHNKGLKVIVDVVANHLAGSYDHFDASIREYEPEIYGSNGYLSGGAKLHSETYNGASNSWCTTNGNIGLPDLNTHDSHVQQRVLSLCKEYIDCGVDGFRFDAAKHIETDNGSEPYGASQFWPTVINGTTAYAKSKGKATPYYYGEILDTCGDNRSYSWYTKYMDVIDNKTGNDLRKGYNSGYPTAQSAYYTTNMPGDKVVVWAESHDTYANDSKESTYVSTYNINKTYAIMGSRNGAEALYFARPTDGAWDSCSTKLGDKGSTAYTWKQVEGVNKFRNYWGTASEYVANNGGFAQVVRYNSSESGMVLVSSGSNYSVSNVAVPSVMKNGTYKDYVTGTTFTVSNGKVSGTIDNQSGIAVLYKDGGTSNSGSNSGSNTPTVPSTMDKNTVYFLNTKNWSNVYVYAWKGEGGSGNQNSNWPGVKMSNTGTKINGCYLYSYTSTNFLGKWEKVIFTNNNGSQTSDLTVSLNQYDAAGNVTLYTPSGSNNGSNNGSNTTTDKNTIYFINTKKWSTVYVYAWKGNGGSGNQNSAWPGVKMTKTGTKVGGYDLYSYTSSNFLGTWTNVIFTNGSAQTKDITITTNCYNAAGTASTYTPTTTTNTNNTVNNNVIYFINTKGWSTVYCYAWKGNGGSGNQLSSWPGVKMTKTSKKVNGYYVWKLESTNILTNWEKVIFTNNSGSQTKDITITTNCYNAAGTASTYNG